MKASTLFHALGSYWRRNLLQLLALVVGLIMATALFSGVQALNAQARTSYNQAASAIIGAALPSLEVQNGSNFSDTSFGALRRAGWAVSPVLEGQTELAGRNIRVIGVDPVSLPAQAGLLKASEAKGANAGGIIGFLTPPGIAMISRKTLRDFGLKEEARLPLANGRTLPPLLVQEGIAEGTVVMDIGAAQAALNLPGQISRLLIDSHQPRPDSDPAAIAGIPLQLNQPEEVADLARLTESFHLNLTAFGLLSFLVGLLIVYSAISLAFQQRLPMFRTLRACGVSARGLTITLLAELLSFALIAGVIGVALGYVIATALLPDVAGSLRGLYGADVGRTLTLRPSWWVGGLGLSVAGAIAAGGASLFRAYRMPPLASAQRIAWEQSQRRWLFWQGVIAVILLASVPLFVRFGDGLIGGFGAMTGLMLGGALILPPVLGVVLRWAGGRAQNPLTEWFWADSRQQLSGLSIALMALLIAHATNIGVGTMVDGFRKTFTGWLDQRFAAEIYFNPASDAEGRALITWLSNHPDVWEVAAQRNTETIVAGQPISIVGLSDKETNRVWPMIAAEIDAWASLERGDGVFVSEQLARFENLNLSEPLDLLNTMLPEVRIVGIYPDYGNPKGQIVMSIDRVEDVFGEAPYSGIRARAEPDDVQNVIEEVRGAFSLGRRVVDQGFIKGFSNRIFEQTFAVTGALNILTLLVAGIAMFMSLLTLAEMRLPQLAPLWSTGVTRRQIAGLELGKTVSLAALTSLLAIPMGIAVAWMLVAVVQVQAFGWRLPLHLFPSQWISLLLLALVTAALAAAIPVLQLRRMAPARLVKVFADAR